MGSPALVLLLNLMAVAPSAASSAAQEPSRLDPFLGRWTCAGAFERSGRSISAQLDFDWDPASAALIVKHADLAGGAYRSVELWSPPAGRSGWRAVIVDAYSGMRRFTSEGWRNEALAWTRDDRDEPAERFTYSLRSADLMEVVWETGRAVEAMQVGDRLRCTRSIEADKPASSGAEPRRSGDDR